MQISQINKLAFIGNLTFAAAMLMRLFPIFQGTPLESLLLIIGLVIGPAVNFGLNLYYGFLFFKGVPRKITFLETVNKVFFALQLVLLINLLA
jgi:hypothetical protein